ncbi:MAG: cytochrome b [Ramlibacter sp.]
MSTGTLASDGVPARPTYGPAGKAFHWTVAALVACQFVTALLLPHIKLDTPLDTTINLHFNFGLLILVVMAARLVHRWRHPVTVAPGDSPRWERTLALAMHRLFYAILLVGPFLGWAAASAHSVPVRLFGVLTLPGLAPRGAEWGYLAGDIHGYAMWTLLALIGIHAGAALYHHFVRHDDVLRRMLVSGSEVRR